MYLKDFHILRPPIEHPQEKIIAWLEAKALQQRVREVACSDKHIAKRGSSVDIFTYYHTPKLLGERMETFREVCDEKFALFYETQEEAPHHLLHVTCTGYSSPSSAQKIAVRKGWGKQTVVTHLYHMGCMASMPAIRIACANQAETDVVHTEVCSLHVKPGDVKDEDIVAMSLFADGFIKYRVSKVKGQLQVIAFHEEMIPHTENVLKWECEEWGMKMTLSKKLPLLVPKYIQGFIAALLEKAGWDFEVCKKAVFAIHPGGPKIIETIKETLGLAESQVAFSKKILYDHGNMSSATVPHIFASIVKDSQTLPGTPVIAVAFGPGFAMSGLVGIKQ